MLRSAQANLCAQSSCISTFVMDTDQVNVMSPPVCTAHSFPLVNGHGIPDGAMMPSPPFMPMMFERNQIPNPAAMVGFAPSPYWTSPFSSPWPFHPAAFDNAQYHQHYPMPHYSPNGYFNDHYAPQPPQSIEWYEYEPSSHSFDFYETENGNDGDQDPELGQQPMAADWDDWQEWAFDLWAEDDDDDGYPSKRLQRIAWDAFRGLRTQSFLGARLDSSNEMADPSVWRKLICERTKVSASTTPVSRPSPSTKPQERSATPVEEEVMEGVKITLPDVLPSIPSCDTLLISTDASDVNGVSAPAPISYAAASAPRNAAETIAAYMNRTLKMHLVVANSPMTDSFPLRHQTPKPLDAEQIQSAAPVDSTLEQAPTAQHLNTLDAMAALARRNSFALRQLNGGLLLIPYPQDEHRYCIGSSTAGRMLIGLEKLSPPRLYANEFRTVCLKKVPYTEDCDKVWCRLNLFRKQIGAEKTAARKNNVAIYEMFARPDQFSYFGRLPYKWNLDEYLKSEYYATTITAVETEGLRILRGIVNGLAYVHRGDFRLFHGNLKPSNVLISSDGTVYLTDYGFGRICCPMWSGAAAHRFCRDSETGVFDPLCWKAYEFFSGCGVQQSAHLPPSLSRETPHRQADVFSAALLGYYAVTGGRSHPLMDGDEAYRKTLHFYRQRVDRFSDFVHLDEITDPTARRLISSMLEIDVKQRPDARYVADHPGFWNDKKRNDFLIAVAEFACATEKTVQSGISQSASMVRVLAAKKVASLDFARRLNSTPEHVAKMAARFGVKFEEASVMTALKTFYRQNRRVSNSGDKPSSVDELEPLWNEVAAEIYDVAYPSPPLKLKQFFSK